MSDAFDGTRKGDGDPSLWAGLVMILLLVVVVVALLLAASGALKGKGGEGLNTQVNPPLLQSP